MLYLIIFYQIFFNFSFIEEKIGNKQIKEFFPQKAEKALFLVNLNEKSKYFEKFKIKPLAYIHNNNYLVYADKMQWEKLYFDKKIKSIRHFEKEWKLNLKKKTNCYRYLKVEENGLKTHRICLKEEDILNFVEREDIAYIENDWELTLRNDTTSWVIQSNEQNWYPFYDENLKGEGEIIGHIDTEIYKDSCYFIDEENEIGPNHRKIVAYRSPTTTDKEAHGTHTAGTAVGYAEGKANNGIARGAKISYTDITYIEGFGGEDSNLYDYLDLAHQDGARIHTNSWGDDSTTEYTTLCYDIDKFSYDNQEDLIVFSVTNYDRLKTPENAKNLVSVGATHQAPSQDKICSGGRGPTIDGRLKPDIFVPGCNINSASVQSQCGTLKLSGTSMASPAVAGASALVREYLKKKYFRTIDAPSSSLIKAILINSGEDLKSVPNYPNFEEGWGRLLLKKTLPLQNSEYNLFIEDLKREEGLIEGIEKLYKIKVSSSNNPLSITLVWTDYPAFPSSKDILINDLDLELTTPSGKVYKGNVIENGESIEGGDFDNKNNVERIILKNPEEGYYELKIKGKSIPMPPQGFSIVLTGSIQKGFDYFLPIVVNSRGANNSNWKTAIFIYNTIEKDQKLILSYFFNGIEYRKEIELQGNEIIYKEDPLFEWFQLENSFGGFKIEAEEPLKIYTRIYNESEEGTFGQSYKGLSHSYKKDEEVYFTGIFLSNDKRTNFGATNFGEENATLKLSLYDSMGNFLGEKEIILNPKQNLQNSIKEIFPSVSILNSGFLKIEIKEGEEIMPYISVITNNANDGIFIEAEKVSQDKKLLPVVVGNQNPTGYPWKTELFIFSEQDNEFKGNLRILQENKWEDLELNLNLQAFQTYYIEDLFQYFNLKDGSGYLEFDGEYLVCERIYSGENISSSYGQYSKSKNINSLKSNHFLYGTIPDNNFRLNIGLTNPSENSILCNTSLYKNFGEKLEEKVIGVEGKNFIQYPVNQIFQEIPIGEPVLIKLECTSNLFAYVSLVDNRTSDGSFFSDF